MSVGQPAHGRRFFDHSLFRQLAGAQGTGAEELQRQSFQAVVAVLRLFEKIEGTTRILFGKPLLALLEQVQGRGVSQFFARPLAGFAATTFCGHRFWKTAFEVSGQTGLKSGKNAR